jgi:hypothetical protein
MLRDAHIINTIATDWRQYELTLESGESNERSGSDTAISSPVTDGTTRRRRKRRRMPLDAARELRAQVRAGAVVCASVYVCIDTRCHRV